MKTTAATNRRGLRWKRHARLLAAALALLAGVGLLAWLALPWVPLPAALFEAPPRAVEFLDRHGQPLREVTTGDRLSRVVHLADVAPALIEATLAAEDGRFWEHPGVDWRASLRAAGQWLRNGHVVSGGSTLTQQLVKLAAPRPRTLRTKVIEAVQALRLEQVWTKHQILAAYLDRIDYGRRCQGSAAAAAYYFGRAPGDLSVAEAAFLAGLPQTPGRLDPHAHFDRAKRRQEWILGRLHARGWLDAAARDRAVREPLRLRPPHREFQAPHFVELLLRLDPTPRQAGSDRVVRTSLDLELNRVATRLLREHLAGLADRNVRNGAVVVLDTQTAEVLALVGSEDYFDPRAGQINGAWAARSPGSTLKPFTYLLALERGWTPASVLPDVPTEFPTPTGVFAPRNYDRRWLGPVRLRPALANSLNVPAVRLLHDLGGPAVLLDRLRACGLTTLGQEAGFYGLGLTLGNAEVRLLELANAYATLGRLGQFRPFTLCARSREDAASSGRPVCEPGAAWLLADILADPGARAPAFGFDSPLAFEFPVACKTGTSTDFRDNWAFGYTPAFTVGVWVGNFDGTPMRGVSGVSGAAPVLHDLFEHLRTRADPGTFPRPAEVVARPVHPVTGHAVATNTPGAVTEWFLNASLPPAESAADYDAAGRVVLPAEYADWLAAGGNTPGGGAVASARTDTGRPAGGLRVLSPVAGTVFFLDPDLPGSGGRVRLRINTGRPVNWSSPTLAVTVEGGEAFARLQEGRHELEVRDAADGATARTWIEVRRW